MGTSIDSKLFVSARKHRMENYRLSGVNEDLSMWLPRESPAPGSSWGGDLFESGSSLTRSPLSRGSGNVTISIGGRVVSFVVKT